MESGRCQEQERRMLQKKTQKSGEDSSFCDMDGLVLPQELGVGAKVPKHAKVASCSEVML